MLASHVDLAMAVLGIFARLAITCIGIAQQLRPMFMLAHLPGRHRSQTIAVWATWLHAACSRAVSRTDSRQPSGAVRASSAPGSARISSWFGPISGAIATRRFCTSSSWRPPQGDPLPLAAWRSPERS